MARTPKDVTDAELAVLELLWQHGPASIRSLSDALYPGGGASEYATVQKLCERLLAKGFVGRDRDARPQRFAASVDRDALIGRQLRTVADKLCGGRYAPLISQLVEQAGLSGADVDDLRALVERLDREREDERGGRP